MWVCVCVRVVVSCVVCGLCRGVWCVRCKCRAWVPCVALCGAVVCCVSVKCCVRVVCVLCVRVGVCVSVCVWCVCRCVCVCVCVSCVCRCLLWCGTLKTSVCAFNTSPCVRSKCPRVYRQHAHMFFSCGHVAGTHGDVLNVHTQAC